MIEVGETFQVLPGNSFGGFSQIPEVNQTSSKSNLVSNISRYSHNCLYLDASHSILSSSNLFCDRESQNSLISADIPPRECTDITLSHLGEGTLGSGALGGGT